MRLLPLIVLMVFIGVTIGTAADAPRIALHQGSLRIGDHEIKADAIPADLCSALFPGATVRIHQGATGNRYHHIDEAGIAIMRYGKNADTLEIFITLDVERRQDHDPIRLYAGEITCNGFKMTAGDVQKWIEAEKIGPVEMGDKWECYWAQYGKWQIFVDKKKGAFTRLSFQISTAPDPVVP